MTERQKIVGARFRPPAPSVLACLTTGTSLSLRLEPENPYDEFAIAVEITGFASDYPEDALEIEEDWTSEKELPDLDATLHLGYIPKEFAATLHPRFAIEGLPDDCRYTTVEGGPGVEWGAGQVGEGEETPDLVSDEAGEA